MMTASSTTSDPLDVVRATRVLRQFRQIFNAVKTHFQQVEKKVGLGGAQVWALSVIDAQPGLSVGELARHMDIQPSTASNLVRSLVERDLVVLSKHAQDKRASCLHLLPAGQQRLQQSPSPFSGVLPQALAQLDTATLARLEHDLVLLIEQLQADASGGDVPLAPM